MSFCLDHVYFISASLKKRVFLVNSSNACAVNGCLGVRVFNHECGAPLTLYDINQVLEENNTGPIWSVFEKKYLPFLLCSGPLSMKLLQLTSGFH